MSDPQIEIYLWENLYSSDYFSKNWEQTDHNLFIKLQINLFSPVSHHKWHNLINSQSRISKNEIDHLSFFQIFLTLGQMVHFKTSSKKNILGILLFGKSCNVIRTQ